jgi:hypothetical protein
MSIDARPHFFTQRGAFALWKLPVCRLSHATAVNFDFISDITDDTESSPTTLTGWENIVFQLQDEPEPEERRAGS